MQNPVARIDWPQRGAGDWLVTRYEDVVRLVSSPELSIRRAHIPIKDEDKYFVGTRQYDPGEPLLGTLLECDAPEHRHLKSCSARLYTDALDRICGSVELAAHRLASKIERNAPFDIVAGFARPLADWMAQQLFEIDGRRLSDLRSATELYVAHGFIFDGGFIDYKTWEAIDFMRTHFMTATPSVPNSLLAKPNLDDTPQGIYSHSNSCMLALTATMQTFEMSVGNCIASLAEHPDVYAGLVANRPLVSSVIEELLRCDGPAQAVGRVARKNMRLGNLEISEGAFIRLSIASANRDESIFADPDVIRIDRVPARHFAFGSGHHHCLGASFARVALKAALEALLDRFSSIVRVYKGDARQQRSALRGFRRLLIMAA